MLVSLLVNMSGRLTELDEEILKIISNRTRARWTEIKGDLSEVHKKPYKGTGLDVVLARSLKRLVDRDMILKYPVGSSRPYYILSAKGGVILNKIQHGLSVEDKYRDAVLAFSSILLWHRNMAVISVTSDNVVDYFTYFKERINEIDVEQFLEELWINEQVIYNNIDPLSLANFTDEEVDYYEDI